MPSEAAPSQARPQLRLVQGVSRSQVLRDAYATHAETMMRVAFRVLGRRSDAEDAVQDAFVELARKLEQLHNHEDLGGWLNTVVVRGCLKKLRRRRLRQRFGLERGADYDAVAGADAPPDARATLAEVYRNLDQLKPELRLAWTLRHVHGLRLDEVARQCECSLATAKRRIASVQEALRRGMRNA